MIPKFRAYFNKYKRMIYSIGVVNENTILVDFNGDGNLETIFLTNDISLMQSTGLKDKNGNEIYEGDICAYYYGDVAEYCEVKWSDKYCTWMIEGNFDIEFLRDFAKHSVFEVIGNIYENSELLEEVEE